jgi:hypothetical protein
MAAHVDPAQQGDVGRHGNILPHGPRMRVISVAYLAFTPELPDPRPGSDARAGDCLAPRVLARKLTALQDHVAG